MSCTWWITLFSSHTTINNPVSRLYSPIWEQLKREGKATLTANRVLHRRIYKAVKKEKWNDIGYKMQIYPYHATLSVSRSNSILTLVLTKHLNQGILTASDL